jgi:hypothetical protein
MPGRLAVASLGGAAALAAAGCGGSNEIKPKTVETFIAGHLLGPRPQSVTCPGGVKAKKGRTFTCSIVYPDRSRATVTVHVTSDEGKVSVSPADLRKG